MILTKQQIEDYAKCADGLQDCDTCKFGETGGCLMAATMIVDTIRHYMDENEKLKREVERLTKAYEDWKYEAICEYDSVVEAMGERDKARAEAEKWKGIADGLYIMLDTLNRLGDLGYDDKHEWIRSAIKAYEQVKEELK